MKKHYPFFLSFFLVLLAYVPTFDWMRIRWFSASSYYSHGVLVPFVVAYLIWQKWPEILETLRHCDTKTLKDTETPRHSDTMTLKNKGAEAPDVASVTVSQCPSALGLPLIVIGLLAHIFSSVMRVGFISGFSMWVVLAGLILHFYGMKMFKTVLFPLVFLLFMIPLPELIVVNVSFRMKMFAAGIAEKVINAMGILAIREGSVIRMPNAFVVVDDVCSGLRSLISLTALGSIFAYWFKGPMWKRWLVFAMTAPIAVATNVCRVVLLSFVAEVWGHEAASGFVHDLSGFSVFALAFLMLLAFGKMI
ncbi:MAG TPA: exosortase/archaeosortase family protein, partial [Candidatus Omnitrophota bacterium]|nr:exosortase/archaeosortase family protein [Candidatus Omnitrophota bacterium]